MIKKERGSAQGAKNESLIKFLLIIRATKVIGANTRDVGSGTRETFGASAEFGAEAQLHRASKD